MTPPFDRRSRTHCGLLGLLGIAGLALLAAPARAALGDAPMVSDSPAAGSLVLARPGYAAPIWASDGDWPGVLRAARDLQSDVERVAGTRPAFSTAKPAPGADAVIVGTLGRSALIDGLVASGKLDAGAILGKWESFLIQVVDNPFPGTARALVIAGSDKRGAIYGIYEVSEQIGVSPWYWWADVPVRRRESLFVPPVRKVEGEPAVRYRGIFLNDEAPELSSWAKEKFGGFNHKFYAGIFELLLRMRANYLWPAMWDNAFNEDDPENPRLADEFGIVMGTSHHEPMMRAQQEWKRHGSGPWNFADNADELTRFWTEGVRRNRAYENIVTIGMRGDGDMPMSQQSNIDLLQRIVGVQRGILAREVNPDVSHVPQLWALYKEVQDYFEKGMRVPGDVTLLWCDDNWGNIRRLPTEAERKRAGGAGIYYHFDYVGGPRSYKWANTYPITKVWEQMHLAWQYGADRIWIVNVGSLKPKEFPIEFFLRYAWAPDKWPSERLGDYGRLWAAREFGPQHAGEIAGLVEATTKLNGRRKPEHVGPETFSLFNYGEADRVEKEWKDIVIGAIEVGHKLPPAAQGAFDELVLNPASAARIVTSLNVAAGRNRLYAVQGRASANIWAATARDLFGMDADNTRAWDRLLGGKWVHFMDQTHLGYTTWQQPVRNAMPAVTELQLPQQGSLGVAIDGSPNSWPTDNGSLPQPVLPELSPYSVGPAYIEVFDRGLDPVGYRISASAPWLHTTSGGGEVNPETDAREQVTVDWDAVPAGRTTAAITVTSPGGATVRIGVPISKPQAKVSGFVESGGCVAIEAPHFDRAVASGGIEWKVLDDFGPSLGAVTPFPVSAESHAAGGASPRLEYDLYLFSAGTPRIDVVVAPSLNFMPGHGLRFAVSLDDENPMVEDYVAQVGGDEGRWAESVLDGVRHVVSVHGPVEAGRHVLKFWRVDPGVVLERIVVDMGGVRPSYLGPPESLRVP